ncbi:MAG: PLP-dependent transferase [Victivallales bacterium]|nr:PLP-dependent transferase [Victivallales bacterium]
MYEIETICVHPARCPEAGHGAIATPIYQSATFVHSELDKDSEYSYSRLQNPTRAALEARVAELEGGVDAIAFASGMAAEATLMNLFEAQGNVIAGDDLYGGTLRLFRQVSTPAGIRFDFTDTTVPENVRLCLQPDTRRSMWKHPATRPCRSRTSPPWRRLPMRSVPC